MKKLNVLSIVMGMVILAIPVCFSVPLAGQDGNAKKGEHEFVDVAEMDLEDLLNIEVTVASKREEGVEDAPGSISVINRQQIQDMNARTLRDVLNVFVPGMDVVPTYFRYGDRVNEGIYSRGILSDFSQQILILYNGQTKFNETTFSSPFPAIEFTLENIERIEISRTPIPLYGGSAITTINLVTREQHLEGFEGYMDLASAKGTSRTDWLQSKRFSAVWGKTVKNWHLGASFQFYQDHGQAHPEPMGSGGYSFDADSLKDGTKGAGNFTFRAETKNGKLAFQTMFRSNVQDAFLSGQVPSQNTDIYSYEGKQWHAGIHFKPSANFQFTGGLMLSKFKNFIDFLGEPFGGEEYNYDLFLEGLYLNSFTAGGTHSLLAGFKLEREGQYDGQIYLWNGSGFDIETDESQLFAPNEVRNVYGLMLEDNWAVSDKFRIVGGLRFDYFDGFREETESILSPRLGLLFKPSKNWSFKALFATASRPPSIYERLGTALAPLKGNADVKSEGMQTVEFSAIFKSGGFKLQATPFLQIFNDKIEYIPGSGADSGWFVANNNGKTEVTGIDLEAWYYFTRRSYVYLTASTFKSDDKQNEHETFFLPNFYFSGVLNWNKGDWNVNVCAYYRNKRLLSADLPINSLYASGSHFSANLNLSYRLSPAVTVYLLAENFTDNANYVPLSVDGLFVPMRKRSIHAGLKFFHK
ncbi:MAG: TonB-dependent receptor [bacterium]|nr:TonB-dependent receptor [bacterium]